MVILVMRCDVVITGDIQAGNPPSAEPILPANAPRDSSISMAAAGAPADVVKAPQPDAARNITALIWHGSDLAIKPIMANRRIERLPEPRWDPRSIPFATLVMQMDCTRAVHNVAFPVVVCAHPPNHFCHELHALPV